MKILQNVDLSQYTAYETGGKVNNFIEIEKLDEVFEIKDTEKPVYFLGEGTNCLIADEGLEGTIIKIISSGIDYDEANNVLIADAGVWWDDLVDKSVSLDLWGLSLMSEIPGSVGAAVVGNIAAYGQAVKDTLQWVEVINLEDGAPEIIRLEASDLGFDYRYSNFQNQKLGKYLILRAAFKLSPTKNQDLGYAVAIKIAAEKNLDTNNLKQRREAIIAAREWQGSIKRKGDKDAIKTTGSFFRNPTVPESVVDELVKHDDWGISKEQILAQNKVHSGDKLKISAALVMLAAGFKAGQSWGNVRLHPSHVLKVENTGNATSQEIYSATTNIQKVVLEKTGIKLIPEVRFLGNFN